MVEDRNSELTEDRVEPPIGETAVDVGAPTDEPRAETEAGSETGDSSEIAHEEAEKSEMEVTTSSVADTPKAADEEDGGRPQPIEQEQTAGEPDHAPEVGEAEEEESDDRSPAQPLELIDESEEEDGSAEKQWYILKVQVNREKSICDALTRRVKVAGLEDYFGEILIPTEDVREFTKTGKQRIVKRKLYPGYILVNMAINDDTWFLVRETPGIGDFTGAAGKPTPMESFEVDRILRTMRPDEEESAPEKTNIRFKQGDRVRVKEGYFQNFEGEVDTIDEANGRITVMINIFGRPTPVELDHWQFEDV